MGPLWRGFVYTCVNGALLTLNVGVASVLLSIGEPYLVATAIGMALHISIAFFVNRSWTFGSCDICASCGLLRAFLVGASGFCIGLGLTAAFVELLHWAAGQWFLYARCIAALSVGVWEFILDTKFTFERKLFS